MGNYTVETLWDTLGQMRAALLNDVVSSTCGICFTFLDDWRSDELFGIKIAMFEAWPECSENVSFPIEGTGARYHCSYINRWDKATECGAARWRLLEHCANYIEWVLEQDEERQRLEAEVCDISCVIDAMQNAVDSGYIKYEGVGICSNFLTPTTYEYVCSCFSSWPEFSGCSEYPVVSDTSEYSDRERYILVRSGIWGANEYGNARRRLLQHCINYFSRLKDKLQDDMAALANEKYVAPL